MRPEIKALYTSVVIQAAMDAYGVSQSQLLSEWHAATFLANCAQGGCVIRLSHAAHRTGSEIAAEVAWMDELIALGLTAPPPLRSVRGRLMEPIGEAAEFTAVAFGLLRGREIGPADWAPPLFEKWGQLVGSLHRLVTEKHPTHARRQWHESDFLNIERYIPDDEVVVKERARKLVARLRAQEPTPGYYGLIHGDVYQDNLRLLSDGRLELYDFDNCEYGWFISDVAVALYAALWRVQNYAQRPAFAACFLKAFLAGYAQEFHLPEAELARLTDFILLRDVLIYTVACKLLDRNNLTPRQAQLGAERRERIASSTPVVPISW